MNSSLQYSQISSGSCWTFEIGFFETAVLAAVMAAALEIPFEVIDLEVPLVVIDLEDALVDVDWMVLLSVLVTDVALTFLEVTCNQNKFWYKSFAQAWTIKLMELSINFPEISLLG